MARRRQSGHAGSVGAGAVVTIANAPANTWTRVGLVDLTRLVGDRNADRNIYSLIVTGKGQKFFSAGADVNAFADGDKAMAREMVRRFGEAFETLSQFRGVSIAAISGYAMGGLECALARDIRIAEEQTQMALP